MPSMATMIRQPNGVGPNNPSPAAMTHLPRGGCTTYDGRSVKMSLLPPSRVASAPSMTLPIRWRARATARGWWLPRRLSVLMRPW